MIYLVGIITFVVGYALGILTLRGKLKRHYVKIVSDDIISEAEQTIRDTQQAHKEKQIKEGVELYCQYQKDEMLRTTKAEILRNKLRELGVKIK